MDTREYLQRLDRALRPLTGGGERLDIVRYYREYLEEAGSEGAAEAMEALGLPEDLARRSVTPAPEPPVPRRRFQPGLPRRAPAGQTYRGSTALVGLHFRSVRLDAPGAQVRLEEGDAFLVRLDGGAVACGVEDGVLWVTGVEGSAFVGITVPRGTALEEVRLRTHGGDISVGPLEVGRLRADAGQGAIALHGARAGVLDLRCAGGISAPGSRMPQRLRGRSPRRRARRAKLPLLYEKKRRFGAMRTNVFLRSTRRQPVRAVCLMLVMLFVTFAFVGRVSEYLLIKQETERLEGYYQAIGTLEGAAWTDTSQAAAYLEQNPLVQAVNTFNYTSGVIEDDICNADTDTWFWNNYKMYFYGTLLQEEKSEYTFRVDTVLASTPEFIRAGDLVTLFPQTGGWRAEDPEDLPKVGERYLTGGCYYSYNSSVMDLPGGGRGLRVEALPLMEGRYFHAIPAEGAADWSDPALQGVERQIRYVRDQQHSLNIIPLQDMSALPMVQEDEPDIYLTEGRWLNGGDDAAGSKVCVVNANFASMRGLSLGDTLTIRLHDGLSHFGYFVDLGFYGESYDLLAELEQAQTSTDTYEIVGIYDYMDDIGLTLLRNYTYIPASAVPDTFQMGAPEHMDPMFYDQRMTNYDTMKHAEFPLPGTVSFLLKDAETQSQFELETRDTLEALGFRAAFLPNGLEAFQTAAKTMRQSSFYNALIYALILTAALGLAVFVYFFMRRHELAIARALGVPAGRCVKEISLPMILLGLAAVLTGSILGWRYTWENAAATLDALSDLGDGSIQPLPAGYLLLLGGAALGLLVLLTVGTAWVLNRIPVLRQVQGGAPAGAKKQAASPDAAQGEAPRSGPAIVTWTGALGVQRPAAGRRRTLGIRYTMRFVWRHIARAKGKTALALILAAVFTVGLAAIRLAIAADREEIERLYQTTTVTIELMKADSTQKTPGGAFLFEDTVQTVLDTGFITDAYLEGANDCRLFRYDGDWRKGQTLAIRPQDQTSHTLRSIESAERFLAAGGTGMTITYLEGWDETLFSSDWDASGDERFPVVLPKAIYDLHGIQPGEVLGITSKGAFHICTVAGYYEGLAAGESSGGAEKTFYDENAPVLLPTSALRSMVRNMLYGKAVFTVDPAKNRDLEPLRAAINDLANTPRIGGVPVRTVVWDQELRMAVEPLEKAVELMELLYPVALVLSLLSGAGAAALLVYLSAKEAAILRVQGTSRPRTVVMLLLQQFLPSLLGLAAGLAGVLIYVSGARPPLLPDIAPGAALCAGLYLLSAIAGAVSAAVLLTAKNPLEMLQVRE